MLILLASGDGDPTSYIDVIARVCAERRGDVHEPHRIARSAPTLPTPIATAAL